MRLRPLIMEKTTTEALIEQIEQLSAQGLFMRQIGRIVGIDQSRISRNKAYRNAYFNGHRKFCARVTTAQVNNITGVNPSAALLIHLGKVYLGQIEMSKVERAEIDVLVRTVNKLSARDFDERDVMDAYDTELEKWQNEQA